MKKTPQRWLPIEQRIEAFQRSPLAEIKMQMKPDEEKLKKISRTKLHRKNTTLPLIERHNNNCNQENQMQNIDETHRLTPNKQKVQHKNRSLFKSKTAHSDSSMPKMILSQKYHTPKQQPPSSKENQPPKVLVRIKNSQSCRNCLSADIKPQPVLTKDQVPQKLRQLRRVIHRKKSQQPPQSQQKQIPLLMQAQRLAYEARTVHSQPQPNKRAFCSLEDFLNEWKQINLP